MFVCRFGSWRGMQRFTARMQQCQRETQFLYPYPWLWIACYCTGCKVGLLRILTPSLTDPFTPPQHTHNPRTPLSLPCLSVSHTHTKVRPKKIHTRTPGLSRRGHSVESVASAMEQAVEQKGRVIIRSLGRPHQHPIKAPRIGTGSIFSYYI